MEIPEYFNFGFDVVDKWAEKDRTKTALVSVDENGENPKNYTFWDLKILSNKFTNVLREASSYLDNVEKTRSNDEMLLY